MCYPLRKRVVQSPCRTDGNEMSQQNARHADQPGKPGKPARVNRPAASRPRDEWEQTSSSFAPRRNQRQQRPSGRTRPPREEPPARSPLRGRGHTPAQSFTCGHCHRFIGPLPSGGHHRNHCPFCLYSRHVDDRASGDRASACGSLMAPIGAFQRPNGEHVVVHRCLGCGFERFNRIAADDDFDLVLALPVVAPRSARRDDDGPEPARDAPAAQ